MSVNIMPHSQHPPTPSKRHTHTPLTPFKRNFLVPSINCHRVQALLRVFHGEVVAALGSACVRLLEGVTKHQQQQQQQQQQRTVNGSTAGRGSGGGSSEGEMLEWLLPLLLVLYLVS